MRTDGQDLTVSVREVGRADPAQYLDAGVTMQGVLVANHDAYGRTGPSRLLVSSTREITITRPAPTAPEIPLLTVQALVNSGSSPSVHRVRMRGAVSTAGDGFRLTDATGAVALDPGRQDGARGRRRRRSGRLPGRARRARHARAGDTARGRIGGADHAIAC